MLGQGEVAKFAKLFGILIIVIIAIATVFGAFAFIGAGHRGVLLTYGHVEDRILPEGVSTITPFVNQVVSISVQVLKFDGIATSASKDLQDVSTQVTLNYHLQAEKVNKIYQTLGLDWESRVIQPAIQEAVKASTAQFTAEELITKRPLVKDAIEVSIKEKLIPFGIIADTVYITDFKFSPQFTNAIESKVTAVQLAQKAENDLERIKIEAQQRVVQAQGEADAIAVQSRALNQNPQYIDLQWVNHWNGVLPTTLIVGGNSPTLLLPVNPVNPSNNSI